MDRIKQLTIKVFPPNGSKPGVKTHRAPKGKVFIEEGITDILTQYAEHIEKTWPDVSFRMIQIGKHAYNFLPDNTLQAHCAKQGVKLPDNLV